MAKGISKYLLYNYVCNIRRRPNPILYYQYGLATNSNFIVQVIYSSKLIEVSGFGLLKLVRGDVKVIVRVFTRL